MYAVLSRCLILTPRLYVLTQLAQVHMRWVTNRAGEQYLIAEDFRQFVRSGMAVAGVRDRVGVYIASDSSVRIAQLTAALVGLKDNLHIYSAPISSFTSDGSTHDALFEALVLSQCDDFIATAGSTFSHFASALGANVPVVVGGSVNVTS